MSLPRAPQTAFVLVMFCAVHAAQAQPGPATPNPKLGASCANDDDCGAGLLCLTAGPAATEGVPPGGLCTASCSADPTICDAIAPGAGCTHLALGGSLAGDYCLEGCTLDQGSPDKCHGRAGFACSADVETTQVCDPFLGQGCSSLLPAPSPGFGSYCSTACEPVFDDAGDSCEAHCFHSLCLPACTQDGDCQAGLSCNPATGLCDSTGRQGGAPGALCDAALPACAGSCLHHRCTEACVVGKVCGPPTATTARCSDVSGAGLGDRGSCSILCNCAADCRDLGNDWVCVWNPFAAVFGFRGACQQSSAGPDAGAMVDEETCAPPPASCLFGSTMACRTDEGCLGVAQCSSDGGYSACVCQDAGVEPPATPAPDAAVSMDASTRDAGGTTVRGDAGPRDGGDDGGGPAEKAYDTDYGGICSVAQVTNRPSSRHLVWLMLVAALLKARIRVDTRPRPHRCRR